MRSYGRDPPTLKSVEAGEDEAGLRMSKKPRTCVIAGEIETMRRKLRSTSTTERPVTTTSRRRPPNERVGKWSGEAFLEGHLHYSKRIPEFADEGRLTIDIRFQPAYQLSEAARYIHVPKQTFWNWFRGRNDNAVLDLAFNDRQAYVSFIGLAEAHVLSSMRTMHGVPLQRIRRALDHLKRHFKSKHPLVDFEFQTDGLDLFVEEVGSLTNVSRYGQTGMRDVLNLYLSRIDRGDDGLPVRLYPFTQNKIESDPRIIVIDPSVSFGRPMIRRSGITTSAVAERLKSVESVASLADDFNREPAEIEAAIRSELDLQPAA